MLIERRPNFGTPVSLAAWTVLLAGLALSGCQNNDATMRKGDAQVSSAPAATTGSSDEHAQTVADTQQSGTDNSMPDASPTAPTLSLFGEEAGSFETQTLPADPMPATANPNSVDVNRVTFAQDGADFDPTISSDGSFMAFASTQHDYNPDIFLKHIGSTVITQLTSDPARDVMPAISPDGQWIAFASDRDGAWNIYVMPREGGRPVQITNDSQADIHPSWSPDGSLLVYSKLGMTSGKWELWVSEIANTSTPHFIGYGLFPEWCPTPGTGENKGDLILYQRSAQRGDRAFGVWTIEYKDGKVGNPSRLIGNATTAYINPTWSPDGRYVVFASVKDPQSVKTVASMEARKSDLWMMTTDGSTMVSLTTGTSTDLLPTWGANGKIYFVSTRTGQDNIWSIDAAQAMYAAGLTPSQPVANVPTDQ